MSRWHSLLITTIIMVAIVAVIVTCGVVVTAIGA